MKFNPWLLMFVLSSTVAAFAQVLLKKSANKEYSSVIKEYLNVLVILGYGLMFVSMFISLIGYRFVEYKNGPVVESVGFFVVMILSRIFFGEKITPKKVIGNLIILAGILVFYMI